MSNMKKILFILNYRAGTNMLGAFFGRKRVPFSASKITRNLVGGTDFINPLIDGDGLARGSNWVGTNHSTFLPTIPAKICPCENYYALDIEKTLATNPPFNHFAWHVQIGDWWGYSRGDTVPEPYEVSTPVRFGPDELLSLPGRDWKFVYILRDGRSQIESLRNIPGGIEQDRHREDPKDYFIVLSKAFRNRAQMVVDCQKRLPNFRVIKFEEFVKDPLSVMENIYQFIELVPDMEFLRGTYELIKGKKEQHSSFGGKGNIEDRWSSRWTDWEKNTFEKFAGSLNRQLGY